VGRVLEGACILLLFVGLQNGARNVYVVKVDLQVVPAKRRRTPRPPTPNAPPLSPPAGDALDLRYGKVPNKCARALIYSLCAADALPARQTARLCSWHAYASVWIASSTVYESISCFKFYYFYFGRLYG